MLSYYRICRPSCLTTVSYDGDVLRLVLHAAHSVHDLTRLSTLVLPHRNNCLWGRAHLHQAPPQRQAPVNRQTLIKYGCWLHGSTARQQATEWPLPILLLCTDPQPRPQMLLGMLPINLPHLIRLHCKAMHWTALTGAGLKGHLEEPQWGMAKGSIKSRAGAMALLILEWLPCWRL